MPDTNQTNTPASQPTPPTQATPDEPVPIIPGVTTGDALGSAALNAPANGPTPEEAAAEAAMIKDVAAKITEAHNILVALSSDPSVDDLSAAIGLTIYLDRIGKRATAIYSGTTPNALEFLKPDETFDTSTDVLQDFVIALSKDKADHLRYKLDGDYVKIYITPYKSRISESDLEFTYGDYNVDLVLALDVANGTDLDSALREHGRIMHDATVINITTAHPGKFGEIEWSNTRASSVSEMAAALIHDLGSDNPLAPEEATAFLTGIIAATDRFSAATTTPNTMKVASDLMMAGADQQLITQNISGTTNQLFSLASPASKEDPTSLDVTHEEEREEEPVEAPAEAPAPTSEPAPEPPAPAETPAEEPADDTSDLLSDLKATEESLSNAIAEEAAPEPKPEKVIMPAEDFAADADDGNKYSKMIDDALAEAAEAEAAFNPALTVSSPAPDAPEAQTAPAAPEGNPAASIAPPVAEAPEINGVPEINYMPLPSDEVLPPPPAPPIDLDTPTPPSEPLAPEVPEAPAPTPEAPAAEPAPAPAAPQAPETTTDASAFKIPGM